MAKRATAEQVAADMATPDYRYGVQHVRALKQKKDRVSTINGEIAEVYARIEGKGVNKKAAKMFGSLDKLEGDERADILRSLNGLIDASGWEDPTDLVDKAEQGDDDEEDAPAAPAVSSAQVHSIADRAAAQRKKLDEAAKKPVAAPPSDDSDLANGAD